MALVASQERIEPVIFLLNLRKLKLKNSNLPYAGK